MKSSKKLRKWTGPALYALFLVVLVEVALRVYLVHFAEAGTFEVYASIRMLENRFENPQVIPHIYLSHTNNTKYDRPSNKHNNLGFRGEETSLKKPEDSFRIVCIGGSTTYGTGVEDYKQSYPYLLQEALQQADINAEVINAGVEGYNSLQSYLNYLLKLEALEPDMLIIYHAINDVWTRMVWPPQAYKADQSGAYLPAKDDPYNFR